MSKIYKTTEEMMEVLSRFQIKPELKEVIRLILLGHGEFRYRSLDTIFEVWEDEESFDINVKEWEEEFNEILEKQR